jgi:hypothetical protein
MGAQPRCEDRFWCRPCSILFYPHTQVGIKALGSLVGLPDAFWLVEDRANERARGKHPAPTVALETVVTQLAGLDSRSIRLVDRSHTLTVPLNHVAVSVLGWVRL